MLLSILAVSAYPEDAEIGYGGLITRDVMRGDLVRVLSFRED